MFSLRIYLRNWAMFPMNSFHSLVTDHRRRTHHKWSNNCCMLWPVSQFRNLKKCKFMHRMENQFLCHPSHSCDLPVIVYPGVSTLTFKNFQLLLLKNLVNLNQYGCVASIGQAEHKFWHSGSPPPEDLNFWWKFWKLVQSLKIFFSTWGHQADNLSAWLC